MDKQEIVFRFPAGEKRPEWTDAFLMYGHVLSHVSCKVRRRTALKAQKGSRCVALVFLYLRRWKCLVVKATPLLLNLDQDTRYPLYRRLGGAQGRPGRVRKISPTPGFDPRTVQPVASYYTAYAMIFIFVNRTNTKQNFAVNLFLFSLFLER